MESATLDDFETLNAQLAALVEAGVPLDVGLAEHERSIALELAQINATVGRRMARGETLTEALDGDERDVPAAYRGAIEVGIRTNNIAAALTGSNRVAQSAEESRFALERAAAYPLIVCTLAYLGLIGFCLYLVPTLGDAYENLRVRPGIGFRWINAVRETLLCWAPVPPVVLVIVLFLRWRSTSQRRSRGIASNRFLRWIPGVSQIQFQERCSRFATSLGTLLDSRVPFSEAMVIAAEASGESNFKLSANSLGLEPEGRLSGDDGPITRKFPAFLRWAIWHSDATVGRARALEIAARTYHESAERATQRLNSLAPVVVLVLLGGVVTLLYCLALFFPVTELLRTLAR